MATENVPKTPADATPELPLPLKVALALQTAVQFLQTHPGSRSDYSITDETQRRALELVNRIQAIMGAVSAASVANPEQVIENLGAAVAFLQDERNLSFYREGRRDPGPNIYDAGPYRSPPASPTGQGSYCQAALEALRAGIATIIDISAGGKSGVRERLQEVVARHVPKLPEKPWELTAAERQLREHAHVCVMIFRLPERMRQQWYESMPGLREHHGAVTASVGRLRSLSPDAAEAEAQAVHADLVRVMEELWLASFAYFRGATERVERYRRATVLLQGLSQGRLTDEEQRRFASLLDALSVGQEIAQYDDPWTIRYNLPKFMSISSSILPQAVALANSEGTRS